MDPYVSCPYNPAHRVPQSRIQRHLVKCEQNYPPLAICPYNATHRVPDSELKKHVGHCPSKEQFLLEVKPDLRNTMMSQPRHISQRDYISVNDPEYEKWDN